MKAGLLASVAVAALCCGAATLLVSGGVLAAGGGLLGSPELTVAAAFLWGLGVWRLVTAIRKARRRARSPARR